MHKHISFAKRDLLPNLLQHFQGIDFGGEVSVRRTLIPDARDLVEDVGVGIT